MRVACTCSSEYPLGERIPKCAHHISTVLAGTKIGNTAPWGHGGGTGVFLKWMVSARVRARPSDTSRRTFIVIQGMTMAFDLQPGRLNDVFDFRQSDRCHTSFYTVFLSYLSTTRTSHLLVNQRVCSIS